ncbi:MAG: Lrp/AsnC ligand binding domain-containing protein [Rikenellaceae bacterium]
MINEENNLDELDNKILRLISNNARISFLEVARICNVSGAAIHQRIQKLMASNIITGSQFTLNVNKIGYETCAYVSLYFDPEADLEAVVEQIKLIPEVVECHFTTGSYDLLIKVFARNNSHLHEIIQSRIRPLGLRRSESTISYRESFHRQITLGGDFDIDISNATTEDL